MIRRRSTNRCLIPIFDIRHDIFEHIFTLSMVSSVHIEGFEMLEGI